MVARNFKKRLKDNLIQFKSTNDHDAIAVKVAGVIDAKKMRGFRIDEQSLCDRETSAARVEM